MRLSTYILCRHGNDMQELSEATRKLKAEELRKNRHRDCHATQRRIYLRSILSVYHTSNPILFKLAGRKETA